MRSMCGRGVHEGRADRLGRQLWRCQSCGHRLTIRSTSAFSGYRFPDEIIALAVRWYLRFRLSYADVAESSSGSGGFCPAYHTHNGLSGRAWAGVRSRVTRTTQPITSGWVGPRPRPTPLPGP